MEHHRPFPCWFCSLAGLGILLLVSAAVRAPVVAQTAPTLPRAPSPPGSGLTGWFHLLWADPPPGEPAEPGPRALLTDDQGQIYRLVVPDSVAQQFGGLQSLDRRRVRVRGDWIQAGDRLLLAHALTALPLPAVSDQVSAADHRPPVTKRYASILCRFSDTADYTPRPKRWYEELMSGVFPGADLYWREVSFDGLNLTGSATFGWYNLPRPRSYYLNATGREIDLAKLFDDATAVADADIFYPDFDGINILFNDVLRGPAFGPSGWWATLDGQKRSWGATFLPPWAHNPSILAHEMGHTLGLPHSSGPYKETYDSRWDVMSGGSNYRPAVAIYGETPVHTIAWHKDKLGYIPLERKYVAPPNSRQTIQLTRLARPRSDSDYLMAQIFIGGWATRFYTVELRQYAGYDGEGGIPGEAVVIHSVDITRDDRNAQVVDVDGNGDPNDAAAMWKAGETFTDSANGISVAVNGATTTGMSVTISVSSDASSPNIVTNTANQGPGSLRNAIFFASQFPGTTIRFNIPRGDPGFSNGVFTLQPTAPLPDIQATDLLIDGASQTAFTGDANPAGPEVILNGARAGAANGLSISGAGCQVRALVINGFSGDGVVIQGQAATGTTVQGCFIGTNVTGTSAIANGLDGCAVLAGAKDTLIGGTSPEARNVISGNGGVGVGIYSESTSGTMAQGNYIGTNATGTTALPNGYSGVRVVSAQNNTIGGLTAGARNVISGNRYWGVLFSGPSTQGNRLQGNFIGTDATGLLPLSNGTYGVHLQGGATVNTIGGAVAGAGNLISGSQGYGIALQGKGTDGNRVQGNLIGTNVTGMRALSNQWDAIIVSDGATSNRIGGTDAGARNVIAGNGGTGISLYGAGTDNNLVQGNFIGTDVTGRAALPNRTGGVVIAFGAKNNTVGGAETAASNVISGNDNNGVAILDANTSGNVVQGNRIGTTLDGTAPLGNYYGIGLGSGAQNNLIGGAAAGMGNLIGGNRGGGIALHGDGTRGNQVLGNFIGTDASGSPSLGNAGNAILLYGGASANTVGGVLPGAGNLIAFSSRDGIRVADANSQGNTLRGNILTRNALLGINLQGGTQDSYGVTANDPGDADTGPNGLQNYPVITSVTVSSGETTVSGTLNSTPGATFALDFYRSPAAHPSGYGEGAVYLGSTSVTTDAGGNATFVFRIAAALSGQFLTATATNTTTGDTSEFSAAKRAP